MKIRTIVICAVVTAMLGGAGAIALAPSAAEEPVALECESWEVPGWLNDAGEPTGCVDNAPCPEAREGLPCLIAGVPVVVEGPGFVQSIESPPVVVDDSLIIKEVEAPPVVAPAPTEESGECN